MTVEEASTGPLVSERDVARAADHIRDHVRRTPVLRLERAAAGIGVPVSLKLECL